MWYTTVFDEPGDHSSISAVKKEWIVVAEGSAIPKVV
jgi:hypothetical protein